jgi:tetratricopeptide (TPR) repeat protein
MTNLRIANALPVAAAVVAALLLAGSGSARAVGEQSVAAGSLGELAFPNSGAPAAQEAFRRGVLLLHSFEYQDAREAFQQASAVDPDFALAYWGEAMSHNHALWAEQDREAALAALARYAPKREARLAKVPTDRERGWLEAVEALYGEGEKAERDRAYERAMAALVARHPEDFEARAFWAQAILGSVRERDFRVYMRAAGVAEELFARNPRHPGALHYLIHAYDDPVHAPLGLRAARLYAEVAPAASHAQHMISHIYTALGDWEPVVVANAKAVAVSEERLRQRGEPLAKRSHHALYWLEYGLLQLGRTEEALAALVTMAADAAADPNPGSLWHFASMRATFRVAHPERTDLPAALPLPGVELHAVAADLFADGYSAWHRGDRGAVLAASRALGEAIQRAAADSTPRPRRGLGLDYELAVAKILQLELDALLLWQSGQQEMALSRLAEAAAAEDARPLEYGPPVVIKPTRELRGELLLAAGRPAEARVELERALALHPNRRLAQQALARLAPP